MVTTRAIYWPSLPHPKNALVSLRDAWSQGTLDPLFCTLSAPDCIDTRMQVALTVNFQNQSRLWMPMGMGKFLFERTM